jgi:hypothetical protein
VTLPLGPIKVVRGDGKVSREKACAFQTWTVHSSTTQASIAENPVKGGRIVENLMMNGKLSPLPHNLDFVNVHFVVTRPSPKIDTEPGK